MRRRTDLRVLILFLGVVGVSLASVLAIGREAAAQSDPPAPEGGAEQAAGTPEIPPIIRLGLRVNAVEQQMPVVPTLVVVPDADAYLDAIERWAPGVSFPVLIDDGTAEARENIARFVHAFEPDSVVRWEGTGETRDVGRLVERIERAMASYWGAESAQSIDEQWKRIGFEPPGVVVAAENDDAWTAGAALAIARGQPIIWTTPDSKPPRATLRDPDRSNLENDLRDGLDATGWPWKDLGDAIDAVTLCLNTPLRIEPPAGKEGDFALTDQIGRHADGSRYAWAGAIFGSEATAAYRAMCAIFLSPRHAWVFDGYNGNYPDAFDAGLAIPLFERMAFDVVYTDSLGANLPTWRARSRTGIRGGFVHVNSAGYPTWFELTRRERAWASETPLLREPSIVHFIHSFSAKFIDDPGTISGRWLENGAYAYVGSVNEPYLQGFVTAEKYFARLFSGVPFGAACRHDGAEPWKIQVVGDPLIVAGKERPRREAALDLPGAESLDDTMKRALQERRFADAVAMLVMLGRDDDALRVTRSALTDEAVEADAPALARASILGAFRAGDADLYMDLFDRLPKKEAARELYTSLLWQILRPRLEGEPEARVVNLLRANIRDDSVLDDAWDLRSPVARLYGRQAMEAMVIALIERTRNQKTKERLREVMSARPLD